MMDYPLTIAFILRRAETLFGHKAIITRRPDKTLHRYTYADFVPRAKKLAVALRQLGLRRGDRVATLCWNQYEHLEAYFGVPLAGNVLHTINPRLHPSDLAYIVNDAEDRVLVIDDTLLPVLEKFRADVRIEHIVVIEHAAQAPIAVAAAKAYCGDAAVDACERSIQVHGGIGFTWEHVLHVYYKRALWIQAFGGYAREHRAQIAAWLLD